MLLKLVKLLILAVPVAVFLLGVLQFVKKARHQTKSQTKARLKKAKWLRADALLLAALVCIAYMFAVFSDIQKQATAVITLNYAEASLGQNANGTRYNMSEIICDDVLARTIEKGGLEDVTVADLKNCLSVYPLIQGKVFRKAVTLPHQMAVSTAVSMGEDVCCLIPTYLDAESVYVSDAAVYFCRCHDDSMSRHFDPAHFAQIAQGVHLLQGAADKAPAGYAAAVERYCAFMGFVLLASAAEDGGRTAPQEAQMLREGVFADAFSRAQFDGITAKSRMTLFLLRRRRVGLAYHFLRLCARLKR